MASLGNKGQPASIPELAYVPTEEDTIIRAPHVDGQLWLSGVQVHPIEPPPVRVGQRYYGSHIIRHRGPGHAAEVIAADHAFGIGVLDGGVGPRGREVLRAAEVEEVSHDGVRVS